MRVKFAAVLLLFFAISASYADTVVDPRLDQKITYQAKGITLQKIVEELSEKTGVTMSAGINSRDWQVRDRKLCIYAKDMPLGTLQKTIARVLHFTWSHGEKNGVVSYRIFQDMKSRKEEDALRTAETDARAKKIIDARTSAIDQMEKLASMSPEELAKLRKDSPFLYLLGKEHLGSAMVDIFRSIPNAREFFAAGRDLSVPISKLPQQAANAAEGLITSMDGLMQKMMPFSPNHASLLNNLSSAQFNLHFPGSEMPAEVADKGFLGLIQIKAEGQSSVDIPLLDPASPMANLMATAALRAMDGESWDKIGADMQKEGSKLMMPPADPGEKEEELPKDDPALDKKIKLEPKKPVMPEVIASLGEKSEQQVVSDYFVERVPVTPTDERTLREVLKLAADTYGKRVRKSGDVITFEDRKWFIKRSWEAPEAWLELWRTQTKAGTLGLDSVTAIACLADEQINHTIMSDDVLQSLAFAIMRGRQILRLYAVLTPSQKGALSGEAGLDLSGLSDDQWAYLAAAEPSVSDKSSAGSRITLHLENTKSGNPNFRLDESKKNEDGSWAKPAQIGSWQVYLPHKAPAADAPKPQAPKAALK